MSVKNCPNISTMNSGISGSLTSSLGCGPGSSALLGGPWDDREVLVRRALKTAAVPKVEAAASED